MTAANHLHAAVTKTITVKSKELCADGLGRGRIQQWTFRKPPKASTITGYS
jgi:hypothetical protein